MNSLSLCFFLSPDIKRLWKLIGQQKMNILKFEGGGVCVRRIYNRDVHRKKVKKILYTPRVLTFDIFSLIKAQFKVQIYIWLHIYQLDFCITIKKKKYFCVYIYVCLYVCYRQRHTLTSWRMLCCDGQEVPSALSTRSNYYTFPFSLSLVINHLFIICSLSLSPSLCYTLLINNNKRTKKW